MLQLYEWIAMLHVISHQLQQDNELMRSQNSNVFREALNNTNEYKFSWRERILKWCFICSYVALVLSMLLLNILSEHSRSEMTAWAYLCNNIIILVTMSFIFLKLMQLFRDYFNFFYKVHRKSMIVFFMMVSCQYMIFILLMIFQLTGKIPLSGAFEESNLDFCRTSHKLVIFI